MNNNNDSKSAPPKISTGHKKSKNNKIQRQLKNFTCKKCGIGFVQRESLKLHRFIHKGSQPFKCEECGKLFSREKALKKHCEVHANKFHCNECGKKFSWKKGLDEHFKIHTFAEHLFKCQMCGQFFCQK